MIKMRICLVSLALCSAILANSAFGGRVHKEAQKRGVLSDLLGSKPGSGIGSKPGKPIETIGHGPVTGPTDQLDGCDRQYPLTPKGPQQLSYAFKRYGITPELVEDPPEHYLDVEYDDIRKCQPHLGNEVNVCSLEDKPSRLKWRCHSERNYTLFLIDLNPLGSDYKDLLSHGILWWVVDIPACDIKKGTALYDYQMPTPLCGSGKLKYVYLVFEQPQYEVDWSEEADVTST